MNVIGQIDVKSKFLHSVFAKGFREIIVEITRIL